MDYLEELMLKFIDGRITTEERQVLESLIEKSSDNKRRFEDFVAIWNAGRLDVSVNFETDVELAKFNGVINDQKLQRASNKFGFALRIAASIIFIALCSWLLYSVFVRDATFTIQSGDELITKILPDGSKVWLNRDTRITYEEDFLPHRTVTLEGEAFFDVQRDPQRPFIIKTSKAQVRVLGTSFNVRAYQHEENTEVLVVTGIVDFSNGTGANKAVVLKPGDIGVLGLDNSIALTHGDSLENTISWKDRRLSFKKTSVRQMIQTLEHYFKVHIEVSNPNLLKCRFTGSFNDPTLSEVLESLSISLNVDVLKQQRRYVIKGDGC